ncbi:carboxymuconolactone decarboxylase family protein [Paludibacterium paludis]|uniref:Alkyl hydroperoxide reductase AhpD n=1 Tax=Paludibacterium paludis TaxID=1225769 RepID=A0A918NWU5_9NEIS|nr:carboxymuconolactone decarboxylase family protein [Paludibacterium paludis]GGY02118.1 alkyl hydroperoxide reductase AhpD [Paludibacterium paludis]
MSYNYPVLTEELSAQLAKMRQAMPDTLKGFGMMSRAANTDGALSHKTKELMAMAIGIANRCQGCLAFHAKALAELECSREEFMEMLQVAIYMGGGPSLMTAAEALQAFESFAKPE